MISYELAKELKDAGFPYKQDGVPVPGWIPPGSAGSPGGQGGAGLPPAFGAGWQRDHDGGLLKLPTLSELIEACGPDFFQLTLGSGTWWAEADVIGTDRVMGETPEEAVARLWLALNKKS